MSFAKLISSMAIEESKRLTASQESISMTGSMSGMFGNDIRTLLSLREYERYVLSPVYFGVSPGVYAHMEGTEL